jgi:hypothetical protein
MARIAAASGDDNAAAMTALCREDKLFSGDQEFSCFL